LGGPKIGKGLLGLGERLFTEEDFIIPSNQFLRALVFLEKNFGIFILVTLKFGIDKFAEPRREKGT